MVEGSRQDRTARIAAALLGDGDRTVATSRRPNGNGRKRIERDVVLRGSHLRPAGAQGHGKGRRTVRAAGSWLDIYHGLRDSSAREKPACDEEHT
jgi:hypothetical protein